MRKTAARRLDAASIGRLVEHHLKLGVTGVMLGGTCGEGPWLRADDRETLTRTTVAASAGRLRVALQVTDNSAGRVLANIEQARALAEKLGYRLVAKPSCSEMARVELRRLGVRPQLMVV